MQTIYVAGPMRGIPLFNFPAFDRAAERLGKEGWAVISPAEMDRRFNRFDPEALPPGWDWNKLPDWIKLDLLVRRDLAAVLESDAIYLLPGWENSKGARAERAVAEWMGKTIIEERA